MKFLSFAIIGRLHPLLVHLPIGVVLALAVLETFVFFRRARPSRDAVRVLAALLALSALFSIASGLTLSGAGEYEIDALERHKNAAIFFAVAAVVAGLFAISGLVRAYRWALAAATVLVLFAGHHGGELTHGEGFLFPEPKAAAPARPAPATPETPAGAQASTFATAVLPVFERTCTGCHGAAKRKGGLGLHDVASIKKGGETGPLFVAGAPAKSDILRRLKLAADDEAHMPPAKKPQPSAAEIAAIEAWIAAGAPFEGPFEGPNEISAERTRSGAFKTDFGESGVRGVPTASNTAVAPPDPAAVAELRRLLVHVEPVALGAAFVTIDVAAIARSVDDGFVAEKVSKLVPNVIGLRLAQSKVGDATVTRAAAMPALETLDLRRTAVTGAGLAPLAAHARLRKLVLSQTAVGDEAIDTLIAMPALTEIYVWKAQFTADGLARLAAARPALRIDTGLLTETTALETEAPVKFGAKPKDAPAPVPPPAAAAKPVNTVCPVSGKPVDPQYTVVHKGRVIGFCCPNCPGVFQANPEKFEAAIR